MAVKTMITAHNHGTKLYEEWRSEKQFQLVDRIKLIDVYSSLSSYIFVVEGRTLMYFIREQWLSKNDIYIRFYFRYCVWRQVFIKNNKLHTAISFYEDKNSYDISKKDRLIVEQKIKRIEIY